MTTSSDRFERILLLVAHPDDETIACAGLLQRASAALVVFAVDGAPPHYGFEKRFGSLQRYANMRFQEASRALRLVPHCSHQRLAGPDGACFVDQHLFLALPEAFASLIPVARQFSPDLVVSHAFEGGHLDHDACHVLATQLARALSLTALEFPIYWRPADHHDVLQQFRDIRPGEFCLRLSEQELDLKKQMLAEYHTQLPLTTVFHPETERFRPVLQSINITPEWSTYPFENRRRPWNAAPFFQKVSEFWQVSIPGTSTNNLSEGDHPLTHPTSRHSHH